MSTQATELTETLYKSGKSAEWKREENQYKCQTRSCQVSDNTIKSLYNCVSFVNVDHRFYSSKTVG